MTKNNIIKPGGKICLGLILLFLVNFLHVNGQDSTKFKLKTLLIEGITSAKSFKFVRLKLKKISDTTNYRLTNLSIGNYFLQSGYLEFRLDSANLQPPSLFHRYFIGSRYFYDKIQIDNVNEVWYNNADFPQLVRKRKPYSPPDFEYRLFRILKEYENKGYPFAKFNAPQIIYRRAGSDSIGVSLHYVLATGNLIKIDSIRIIGKIREKPKFVRNLIRISSGDIYKQENIDRIPSLLNNTMYYQNAKEPVVIFTDKTAVLVLQMERKKSNRFDGVFGVLPPRTPAEKVQFTGLLDLMLVSALKMGEVIQFHFDQLPNSSQNLELKYQHPYLLGLPLQFDFKFTLLKQDTLFLSRTIEPKAGYIFTQNISANLYSRTFISSILSTKAFETLKWPPPAILDSQSQLFGVGFVFDNVDYKINPSKGFHIDTDAAFGFKNISKNSKLDSLEYNRLQLRQPRQEVSFNAQYYRKTFRNQVIVFGNKTYWLNLKQYYDNDQKFVGGSRSLRGFNENQFLASFYTIFTLEYRLKVDRDAYIGVFADYGYLEYRQFESVTKKQPFGTGILLSMKTPVGVVSVSYAVGMTDDQPFLPARGRIHVGLVNQF